ncbi:MAG: DUF3365 domain-containing protein [Campylobacterota bacterium]|nr:DUF3365 domain-containing protein [Campylobacterota bacterium]
MNLNKLFIGLGIVFILLIFASFKYSESKEIGFNHTEILNDVKSIVEKDLIFRKWIAMHGGVYVPITKKTPSNKYLSHIPNRDVLTTTGMELTLMNPAYALRQFMSEFKNSYGEKGKIVSLKLINPYNAPDNFEKIALQAFDKNNDLKEYYKKVKNYEGQLELRYVKPLITRKTCLKCHAYQNYKVGDIRGGISIVLPLKKYNLSLEESLDYLKLIHIIALSLGMLFLYLTYLYLKKQQAKEMALSKQINEVYNIFNTGNIVLFRWNNDERLSIDFVSDNVSKILGYTKEEFMHEDIRYASIIDSRDIDFVKNEVLEASQKDVYNFTHKPYRVKIKNGKTIWVNDASQVILDEDGEIKFYVGYIQDITVQQNQETILKQKIDEALEENTKQLNALQQQSKMASMGEMIGAIAHQWRQPLNELSISIQNLKYDYKKDSIDEKFLKEFIGKNKKTISFMSKTIDDFRSFFRLDKEKNDFSVKETTEAVVTMLSAQIKTYNIEITIIGKEFIYCGFQSEYQQVILNIINNAKDAFIENKIQNPKIQIVLDNNKITLQDNAGGIPSDIIQRVFEPYFTTKEQGKGTGMGLYMSKMIIDDNMGAKLSVVNKDDGACFSIEF